MVPCRLVRETILLDKIVKIYASQACPGSKSSCESPALFFTTKRNHARAIVSHDRGRVVVNYALSRDPNAVLRLLWIDLALFCDAHLINLSTEGNDLRNHLGDSVPSNLKEAGSKACFPSRTILEAFVLVSAIVPHRLELWCEVVDLDTGLIVANEHSACTSTCTCTCKCICICTCTCICLRPENRPSVFAFFSSVYFGGVGGGGGGINVLGLRPLPPAF